MRPKFAVGFRSWCVAVALCLATAHAAEPHPLLGASREQVLTSHGAPKSQLATGNREVLFYPGERLVLRDGIVVEVEPIAEPVRNRTPEASQANDSTGVSTRAEANTDAPTDSSVKATDGAAATTSEAAPETAPPPAESTFEIKRVLSPSASAVRPTPRASAPARSEPPPSALSAAVSTAPRTAPKRPDAVVTEPALKSGASNAAKTDTSESTPQSPGIPSSDASAPANSEDATALVAEKSESDASFSAAKDAAEKDVPVQSASSQSGQTGMEADAIETTASAFTPGTYIIALLTISGGIAYLVWRSRQRQLLLAATAVSGTPFSAPAATTRGTIFDAAFLSTLDWKRFEALVASYYSKTGVVASSTNEGPDAPVHIKISWKGEPRPFALVQCIAHPTGLIDAKPIQELFTVLTAEDIRRGYVVTTGKFNVPARDFAEEKHITLLPGDIFLEKINALPDAARAELMQEINAVAPGV